MTINLSKRRGDKPCPFCGKMDLLASEWNDVARVECTKCGASGPVVASSGLSENAAIGEAIALWNGRVEVGTR